MTRLAALALLSLALPVRANVLTPATTDAESKDGRRLIESNNGAGARGCLTERQTYEAYHRVDGALAWNPNNPADWYVGRNTIGLVEWLVMQGYGEASRNWNAAVHGTDFQAIGEPCRAARSPRALAACFNDQVKGYYDRHPEIRPSLGGPCKMYAATVVAVSSYYPAVTRQASVVASAQHAFNKLSIRDDAGREHLFLIDALNNVVIQLSDDQGACPEEGTLSPPPASAADQAAAREKEAESRMKAAGERVGRAEGAAPAP
jgi:hypothetical protein